MCLEKPERFNYKTQKNSTFRFYVIKFWGLCQHILPRFVYIIVSFKGLKKPAGGRVGYVPWKKFGRHHPKK